jgi:hypothetical protein
MGGITGPELAGLFAAGDNRFEAFSFKSASPESPAWRILKRVLLWLAILCFIAGPVGGIADYRRGSDHP